MSIGPLGMLVRQFCGDRYFLATEAGEQVLAPDRGAIRRHNLEDRQLVVVGTQVPGGQKVDFHDCRPLTAEDVVPENFPQLETGLQYVFRQRVGFMPSGIFEEIFRVSARVVSVDIAGMKMTIAPRLSLVGKFDDLDCSSGCDMITYDEWSETVEGVEQNPIEVHFGKKVTDWHDREHGFCYPNRSSNEIYLGQQGACWYRHCRLNISTGEEAEIEHLINEW